MNTYVTITIYAIIGLMSMAVAWQSQTAAETYATNQHALVTTSDEYFSGSSEQKTGDSLDKSIGDTFAMGGKIATAFAYGFSPITPPPIDQPTRNALGNSYIIVLIVCIFISLIKVLIVTYTCILAYDKFKNKSTQ